MQFIDAAVFVSLSINLDFSLVKCSMCSMLLLTLAVHKRMIF